MVISLARPEKFNVEKWARIFDKPYVQRDWMGYDIGSGYLKYHDINYGKAGKVQNTSNRKLSQVFVGVLNDIIDGNWEHCASLYTGFIAFLFKDIPQYITYYETDKRCHQLSTNKMCEELRFPLKYRDKLLKIFTMDLNFEDYLRSCATLDKINFDLDSAISVYRMQGDEAIFSILMQIFYQQAERPLIYVALTPGIPIKWTPKVDSYVSGTSFPVVVTPFSNKFRWVENDEGWFLLDEYGNVIDCAGVGLYGCFRDHLANRLSFTSRVGQISEQPYIICWTWKEIVDALGFFKTRNVLIRRLNEDLMNGHWFKFGLDGLIVLYISKGGHVSSRKNGRQIHGIHIAGQFNVVKEKFICSISGELKGSAISEDVVWSNEEIKDWFVLGEMCRTSLF